MNMKPSDKEQANAAAWKKWIGHACCLVLLAGCSPAGKDHWQGYIEADFVRVSAPLPGALEQLKVKRGDTVKAGSPLFILEQASEQAACKEADGRVEQARARLENLKKGRRPTEIASIEARLAQAKTGLELSTSELKRWEKLFETGVASHTERDRVKTAFDRDRKTVEEWTSELATARLGARTDEIKAAEADVAAGEAALQKAQWSLSQKSQTAPKDAMVFDTLYTQGEWVAAGYPVVTLLPAENIKVRLFVPETALGALRIGQNVSIRRDGASQLWKAKINYIAPQSEYTPPVIYSQENRAKLVFMAEASFESPDPAILHPGQPVDVSLAP
jgi:HlyD family secretion protein